MAKVVVDAADPDVKPISLDLLMLKCRAYGHAWEDRGWLAMIRNTIRGWEQLMTCSRCRTSRSDFRARGTLKLIARSYVYLDAYPGKAKQINALTEIIAYETARTKDAPKKDAPSAG